MKDIKDFTSGSLNPLDTISTIKYKIMFARDNPDYFYPDGIWCFCGPQGSGKTLSAVACLKKICKEYPKALVCTNIEVKGIENTVIPFTHYEQLTTLTNGVNGIIFLIDELHVLWNSLESKDIPISEMACFCQMRKDRRVIIGTSQVYSRIAKPIREQLKYVVDCHNILNLIQWNLILDPTRCEEKNGHIQSDILGTKIWLHSPKLYESYDTLLKIVRIDRKDERKVRKYGRTSG